MENLKKLALFFILIVVFAVPVLGGETSSPPCAPGETHTPPCNGSGAPIDDSTPGELNTPPASGAFDIIYDVETALWSALLF